MKYQNKYVISALLLFLFPVSVSVNAGMEVKGFSFAESATIKDVYGSCHRLEEPLTIKIVAQVNYVAGSQGWIGEIKYRFKDQKKYISAYFSDSGELTDQVGVDIIHGHDSGATEGPDSSGFYLNEPKPGGIEAADHLDKIYYLTLPTRNLDYLSIGFRATSNKRGNTIIFDSREGNFLKGNWLSKPVQTKSFLFEEDDQERMVASENLSTLTFNLVNLDYLLVQFQQRDPAKPTPNWTLTANKMTFRDGEGYTAEQFKAACK